MRYVCQICGYVYDEAKEKIPFEELSDTWKCPLCGALKSDFKPEEKKEKPVIPVDSNEAVELQKLSAGQMSTLCSNLARGCEKQYNAEAAGLFKELADYFAATTPAVEDANVKLIASRLQDDIDNYGNVRATADAASDRGAARICVWGEKVTRMLSSLVNRYLDEGEEMLADTDIWVCTVCGFVYVGDAAPGLCPVCKVPDWKFEKVEGRTA